MVRHILTFARHLETFTRDTVVKLLGPAPCLMSKQHGQFFWNLYAKGPDMGEVLDALKKALEGFQRSGVTFTLDVDPL